ncbi:MAG: hypothetical protein IPM24_14515 [Bryobacterales bacterium]|nr:hypothetical protein [Bryobacterales bacterium]
MIRTLLVCTVLLLPALAPAQSGMRISKPMTAPEWALLQRELLQQNSAAADLFAERYVDSRGYLLHTPRWGTLDGPDDAIETFYNWTLLHALGGSDSVLEHYKRAQEGHWQQYKELRTELTKLSEHGSYYKEFITQSDWFHTGEGMRGFMFLGLSEPNNEVFRTRMKRFAGMYMNEDPEAPNYDPEKKLIKSIWTGSKGPMLHKATTYDWVGDPVPGSFHLLHNEAGYGKLLNLEAYYPKMLAHCDEYLDSVGDHPLNLAATNLALNAYMLTGDEKYRNWVKEYVGAWKERTAAAGGNIPSNVGLDGKPGGEYNGQWWKGTYGWNFTIFDGEIEKIAHRNTVTSGAWPGFSNAFLMTGDPSFIGVLRKQMDNIYAAKKVENGRELLPRMYGDPNGYKHNGAPSWYQHGPSVYGGRLTEIYLWSMDRKDFERVPKEGWIAYLEGQDPEYPVKALRRDLERVRRQVERFRTDDTTADTRLADYLLGLQPVATDALTNLTVGGHFAGRIWTLHSRFRYFDAEGQRAGLPPDVSALVEKLSADSATVTVVNVGGVHPRTLVIQAGGYGEHHFDSVTVDGKTTPVNGSSLTVRLEPGAGAKLEFKMARYKNAPTLAFPWDRAWYTK